jgi:hypothetical protein
MSPQEIASLLSENIRENNGLRRDLMGSKFEGKLDEALGQAPLNPQAGPPQAGPPQTQAGTDRMVVRVSKSVVAGADRGGEDLFLVFEGEVPVVPHLRSLRFTLAPLGDDFVDEGGGVFTARSDQYEFEWRGFEKDLMQIVGPAIRDEKNWTRGLRGEGARFRFKFFVDGNAE